MNGIPASDWTLPVQALEPTVAEVLALEPIQAGMPEVVAGAEAMSRRVRWVHISDLTNAAHSLSGGELLLTHGLGLSSDEAAQRRFVTELADVEAAGVVLELGNSFTEPPSAMVEEADHIHLPLVCLRQKILFMHVTEAVHADIVSRHYRILAETEEFARGLRRLACSGSEIRAILHRVAAACGNPVTLENAAHQLIDYAPLQHPVTTIIDAWRHLHAADDPEMPGHSIVLRGDIWGRLRILPVDRPVDSLARLLGEEAGVAILLALLQEPTTPLPDHAHGGLIADLLEGRITSTRDIEERAAALGVDLRGRPLLAVDVELKPLAAEQLAASSLVALTPLRSLGAARALLNRLLRHEGVVSICRVENHGLRLIVAPVRSRSSPNELFETIRQGLERQFDAADHHGICIGVSTLVEADGLRLAFDQAHEAVRGARMRRERVSVAYFEDLGLERLFVRLADGPALAQFVESQIGKLLTYDAHHRTDAARVLRAYLEAGCSKSEAARKLYIGRRSLYEKLERINAILSRDVDDPEVRSSLMLAFQALDFLAVNSVQTSA